MGRLVSSVTRAHEVLSFEYDDEWLQGSHARQLDPSIQLFPGLQYPRGQKPNFGMFLDSSPDRWGSFVQDRREAQIARSQDRSPKKLQDTDYLLGVHDVQRLGGLRFKLDAEGRFLDDHEHQAAPPWAQLPDLERAAHEIEREGVRASGLYSKWLAMLVAPGGSLGGARPSAGVVDDFGQLWIAKFPGQADSHDVGRWEWITHLLAAKAGINIAPSAMRRFASKRHTFLTQRFDRTALGERIHFASAMTMLSRKDGDDASTGASYLEIAEFLELQGALPSEDLSQLWRRIAFNVCVSNADDHLRNHGFLLTPSGWRLSPAYDMNPVPGSDGLKLLISERDNSQDLDLVLEVAPFFRLKRSAAEGILTAVLESVKAWKDTARSSGATEAEIETMVDAFRLAER